MKLKSIASIKNIYGKKILIRVDYNVTLGKNNKLGKDDDARIRMSLPTMQYLLQKGSILIIMAHMGRPDGAIVEKLRLHPLAKKLSQLLGKKVIKLDEIVGDSAANIIQNAKAGDIIMLENLRFDPREENNDDGFAKKIAELGDIYVNEAFSNSHRKHASMISITKYLPSYGGFLLEKEVENLSRARQNPKRPLTVIIGGTKISTKIGLIKKFLDIADHLLVGGALANMMLKAKGISVGKSVIEKEMADRVKEINLTSTKLHIPVDVVVSDSPDSQKPPMAKAVGNVLRDEYILDIGPDTIKLFHSVIKESKTIIWNGPMGYVENPKFKNGTKKILKAMLFSSAHVVIGGGDSLKIIGQNKLKKNIFLSSGGGAMLEFLEKGTLPALQPLIL